MATFRYRAATPTGAIRSGAMDGANQAEVVAQLRRQGLRPIEMTAAPRAAVASGAGRARGQTRQALINAIGELAILIEAGLALDRALAVCIENIANPVVGAAFTDMLSRVKEGATLSSVMATSNGLFPPVAAAMCEAGEADGRLGPALARLAESLDRAEALRQTVVSSLIYPAMLMIVATGVVLLMLLVVVPQFDTLFSGSEDKLPPVTRIVIGSSRAVRSYGLVGLGVIVGLGVMVRQWLARPGARLAFDRGILDMPRIGALVVDAETAAFARTLGSLVDAGVPLPVALGIAQRSINNSHMAGEIAKVAAGLKEGGGLTGPLAASGVLSPMALSFLRTGEETARLGPMLERLADVLDRAVRASIQRLIGVLTPAITVVMAAVVATVIASIMSAILGFNDLAVAT